MSNQREICVCTHVCVLRSRCAATLPISSAWIGAHVEVQCSFRVYLPPLRIWLWPPEAWNLAASSDNSRGRKHCLISWRRWAPSASSAISLKSKVSSAGAQRERSRKPCVVLFSIPTKTWRTPWGYWDPTSGENWRYRSDPEVLFEAEFNFSSWQERYRYREHTQSRPFFWNRFWFCRSTLIASRNFHSDRLSSCVLGRKKRCCKGCIWKQECKAKPTDAVVYVANCNKLAFISVKFPCTTYTKLALLFSCGTVWRASSMLMLTPIVSDTSLCLVRGISAQARARNSENSFHRLRADNRWHLRCYLRPEG